MKVSLNVSSKLVASVDYLDLIVTATEVVLLFVRDDIPAKLIFTEVSPIEGFYVEINLREQKWLICCSYNPNKHNTSKHIEVLSKSILLMGDFNPF